MEVFILDSIIRPVMERAHMSPKGVSVEHTRQHAIDKELEEVFAADSELF